MIKYSLVCEKDHDFEGWFGSSDDFETQAKRGFVDCPVCGSTNVTKSLMAPRVSGTKKSNEVTENVAATSVQMPAEIVEKLREVKKYVEANSENVGDKFPEEARKIHYGETEERGIYGKASADDVASLAEEGVNVLPLPELPEEKN